MGESVRGHESPEPERRWDPESGARATREQTKEEWRRHILKQIEEHDLISDTIDRTNAQNLARVLADEYIEYIGQVVERLTGHRLP